MTQEDRELLLKELCARLPFGISVKWKKARNPAFVKGIDDEKLFIYRKYDDYIYTWECCIENIKPYLRPMSSMTEEERLYFHRNSARVQILVDEEQAITKPFYGYTVHLLDWLNAHHFDYRGLIEKGLALEAPEGLY